MGDLSSMRGQAIAVGVLAAVVLTTLAVITGFRDTGLVNNATADNFTTGLAIFGTFAAVIVLAIVGKLIIGLFKGGE